MTAVPVAQAGSEAPHRVTAEDGSRFYWFTNPDTGEQEQFWSVTTALDVMDKPGLKFWAAKLSAARAVDSVPRLVASLRVEPCENARSRTTAGCGRCPECMQVEVERVHIGESSRRAVEGSAVHNALEHFIGTGQRANAATVANMDQRLLEAYPGRLTEALPPYLERLWQWIDEYAIEPDDFLASEMTVYNTTHRYAGTLDAILRLMVRNKRSARIVSRLLGRPVFVGDTVIVILDCKSREGEGKQIYADNALQMTAYRHCDLCMPSKVDRLLKPMIETQGAVILQVRPDGYTFEPVLSDEENLKGFIHALELYRWSVARGAASIAVKTFAVPLNDRGEFFLGDRPAQSQPVATVGAGGVVYDDADPHQALAEIYEGYDSPEAFAADTPTLPVASEMPGPCAGCGRMNPKRRTSRCSDVLAADCAREPRMEKAPAATPRIAGATLESIARSRIPGAMLTDEDIPF